MQFTAIQLLLHRRNQQPLASNPFKKNKKFIIIKAREATERK